MFILLIPEARKKPLTNSLLYRQIIKFFQAEGFDKRFQIAFITLDNGIVEAKESESIGDTEKNIKLPPRRFRSGRLWVKDEQIQKMAGNITNYLNAKSQTSNKSFKAIAYVRGSYLVATKLASKKSGLEIKEIFTDQELKILKKKGFMWMKVGLRMPEAFKIFQKRIIEFTKSKNNNQPRAMVPAAIQGEQLKLSI